VSAQVSDAGTRVQSAVSLVRVHSPVRRWHATLPGALADAKTPGRSSALRGACGPVVFYTFLRCSTSFRHSARFRGHIFLRFRYFDVMSNPTDGMATASHTVPAMTAANMSGLATK
jgi:hypothetical protein